ncbi:MAG: TIGR00730 family Rossman fold protein, partial [Planctomycetota bacterium]
MKRITVYCSSSTSLDPKFFSAATELGRVMATRGIELVYGGGSLGLMGEIARTMKKGGGRVHGIITKRLLALEQGFDGCDELVVVDTMSERKRLMAQQGEAFIALPGGLGTFEEFFEVLVQRQVG